MKIKTAKQIARYMPYVRTGLNVAGLAYKGYKSYKKFKSYTPREERQENDAQPNIGYGQHDARISYNRKKKRFGKKKYSKKSRRATNKALNKRQKRLVRKIARKVGIPNHYKNNTHMNLCLKTLDTGGNLNIQGNAVFVENTGRTGFINAEDKGNHFNDIFTAAFVDADLGGGAQQKEEQMQKLKMRFVKSQTKYQIVCGASTPNAMIEAHFFVCKRSIPYDSLSGTLSNGIAEVFGATVDTCQEMVGNAFNNALLDRTDTDWEVITSTTPGWDPRDESVLMKEYFTWEKTQRYNVSANSNIVIDNDHRIGMVMNNKTVSNYAFIKNVSRIVIFTILGVPVRVGETTSVASAIPAQGVGSFGCYVKQEHKITWQPVWGSPDQVLSGAVGISALTSRGGYKPITVAGSNAIIDV